MIKLALYIGAGAICHLIFAGTVFDFHSVWTLAWLLAWPVMLVINFILFLLAIGAVCGLVVLILHLTGKL